MNLSVELRDSNGICNLPLNGYDFDDNVTISCDPILIVNSNNTFNVEVASGSTYVLPDMTVEIQINGIFKEYVTLITLDQ